MTNVVAEGYYPWYEVLNQTLQRNPPHIMRESILVDLNNDTCVLVNGPGLETLQAIFNFPQYNSVDTVSVDVLTKASGDCSSSAWTWFVGSSCSPYKFRECYNVGIEIIGDFHRCRVTCVCSGVESCELLHIKYTFDHRGTYIKAALCEVNLVYGDVNLPYYGMD